MTRETRYALNNLAAGAVLGWVVPITVALLVGWLRERLTGRASW